MFAGVLSLLSPALLAENATQLECVKGKSTHHGTVTEFDGKLITCWHTVKEGGEIRVWSREGWVICSVVRVDIFLDLALLKPEKKVLFTSRETEGITAYCAPLGVMQTFPVKIVDHYYAIDAENVVDHGASGGCILDVKGKLLGIIRGLCYVREGEGKEEKMIKTNRFEFVPKVNVQDFLRRGK